MVSSNRTVAGGNLANLATHRGHNCQIPRLGLLSSVSFNKYFMLEEINKAFRADPVIKNCLKKSPEPMTGFQVRDAMYALFARYPALEQFWEQVCYSSFIFCQRDRDDEFWSRMKVDPTDNRGLDWYIREDARKLAKAARGGLSAFAKKELVAWVHNNSNMRRLDRTTQNELRFATGLRPHQPLKLYRGLLFSKWQFGEDERMQNHPKSARIFMDALKHGHTTLKLHYPNCSSWTAHPDVADRFAKHSPASSEFGAMMNWIHNAKKFIDRELGLVISATISPDDILCDVSKINLGHLVHGNEGEFIVRPDAELTVQVEHIYLPTGEISVDKFEDFMNYIASKAA